MKHFLSINQPYLLQPVTLDLNLDCAWGQYNAVVISDGNLLIFDNRYEHNFEDTQQYIWEVEYRIKENKDRIGGSIEQVWKYGKNRGRTFFSLIISGVQYLENSKTRLIVLGALKYDINYVNSLNNWGYSNTNLLNARIVEAWGYDNVCFEMVFKSAQIHMVCRIPKMKLYNS